MRTVQLLFLSVIFTACSNNIMMPENIKNTFSSEKPTNIQIHDHQITYILPQSVMNQQDCYGLKFANAIWGRETAQNKVIIKCSDQTMQIERRIDNGIAGSGRIYTIEISKIVEANNILVTLQPKSMKSYQDGVILPFPIPEFDLQSFLTSAQVKHKFEINSEFPNESIKANFDRSFGFSKNGEYNFQLSDASVNIFIKIYPYRTGSKTTIIAELSKMKPSKEIIDVNKTIKEMEGYLQNIVNS